MQKVNAWEKAVAKELGLPELSFTSLEGGRVELHLPCRFDGVLFDIHFSKRLPPEAICKKLQQVGCSTRAKKFLCPNHAVKQNAGDHQPPLGEVQMERQLPPPVAKISKNDVGLSLTVPKGSPILENFVDEKFNPIAYWGMEITHDQNGVAQLILERKTPPEGQTKARGMARGTFNEKGNVFSATMSNTMIDGVHQINNVGATPIEFDKQSGKFLIFTLPDSMKAPAKIPVPEALKEPAPVPKPKPEVVSEIITKKPEPVAQPVVEQVKEKVVEEVAEVIGALSRPAPAEMPSGVEMMSEKPRRPARIITSKNDIGLHHAVEMIHYYKSILGDNMEMSIENGKLKVIVQYG